MNNPWSAISEAHCALRGLTNDEKTVVFTAIPTSKPLEWRLWLTALDGSSPMQLTKGGELRGHLFPVWLQLTMIANRHDSSCAFVDTLN
jgi:hypothetical protein